MKEKFTNILDALLATILLFTMVIGFTILTVMARLIVSPICWWFLIVLMILLWS